ncbi:MAG: methyltransferase domain-containing protein [Oscillospiraceae bacterium]|nr:methyltransferase domain-containing protein [Oscillospiraceae bacterium]
MEKKEVIEFFDTLAPQWDADMVKDDAIIGRILDAAGVSRGAEVLDVACGTGVLFPYYLAREVNSVTGLDISGEMVRIAREKYADEPRVAVVQGDAEILKTSKKYDCVVVYNAFPHFPSPEQLIENLAGMLNPGGVLTVAHNMSREAVDRHHAGRAGKVSMGLPSPDELSSLFSKYVTVETVVSDDRMYQVSGRRQ